MKKLSTPAFKVVLVSLGLLFSAHNTVIAEIFTDVYTVAGKTTSLDKHIGQGKWTLVMFWTTDCVSCAKQKPRLSALYDKRKNKDLSIVGVALDGLGSKSSVLKYLEKHPASFPNYISSYEHIAQIYDELTDLELRGTPTYLMYNPSGKLVGNQRGPIAPSAIESFIAN